MSLYYINCRRCKRPCDQITGFQINTPGTNHGLIYLCEQCITDGLAFFLDLTDRGTMKRLHEMFFRRIEANGNEEAATRLVQEKSDERLREGPCASELQAEIEAIKAVAAEIAAHTSSGLSYWAWRYSWLKPYCACCGTRETKCEQCSFVWCLKCDHECPGCS